MVNLHLIEHKDWVMWGRINCINKMNEINVYSPLILNQFQHNFQFTFFWVYHLKYSLQGWSDQGSQIFCINSDCYRLETAICFSLHSLTFLAFQWSGRIIYLVKTLHFVHGFHQAHVLNYSHWYSNVKGLGTFLVRSEGVGKGMHHLFL